MLSTINEASSRSDESLFVKAALDLLTCNVKELHSFDILVHCEQLYSGYLDLLVFNKSNLVRMQMQLVHRAAVYRSIVSTSAKELEDS